MPRINLDSCPITMELLNSAKFNQSRLVIVGNCIYPVIGEEAWSEFTSNLHCCPFTRSTGNYQVLVISALPENLRTQLHDWLLNDKIVDNTAPRSPTELVALLVSQPDSTISEESVELFARHLIERNFSTPPTPITAFFQPAPEQARWWMRMDRWDPYYSGGVINRCVSYRNIITNHIKGVDFYGYNDGTYSIGIQAAANQNNESLIFRLQERNFNPDTANITRYPDNRDECYFELRGTLGEIAQQLDSILGVIEDLEGPESAQKIRNEMSVRLQPAPPPRLN